MSPLSDWIRIAVVLSIAEAQSTLRESSAQSAAPALSRACHGTVYHASLRMALMFGGAQACGRNVLSDSTLWGWSGDSWKVLSSSGPGAREDALLAYDGRRNRLVLYGGRNAGVVFDDTWEWDTRAWKKIATQSGPGRLEHAAMTYDSISGEVVLFGGAQRGRQPASTLWLWNGARWEERNVPGPSPRIGPTMSHTPHGVLLYGGFLEDTQYRDLWQYQDGKWVLLSSEGPTFTEGPASAWMSNGLVVIGPGLDSTPSPNARMRAWRWTDRWEPFADAGPMSRVGATAVPFLHDNALVYVGGTGALPELWELRAGGWTRRSLQR